MIAYDEEFSLEEKRFEISDLELIRDMVRIV
jgi:hypothetical protein